MRESPAQRRARRPRRAGGRSPDRRGPEACPRPRHRPPGRKTFERPCWPNRTMIDVRLLDFGLAQMAEFDTLTALGDISGNARLHLPRNGSRGSLRRLPRTSGRVRGSSCSRRSPASTRSGAADLVETSRRHPGRRTRSRSAAPGICPTNIIRVVAGALTVNPQRAPQRGRSGRRAPVGAQAHPPRWLRRDDHA